MAERYTAVPLPAQYDAGRLTQQLKGIERTIPWESRVEVFHVSRFGARMNGTTDDTRPLQNAIAEARAAGGGIVQVGPGILKFTEDLDLTGLWFDNPVTIRGAGRFATSFKPAYVDTSGSPFDCSGSACLNFEHFSVISSGSHGQIFLFARTSGDNSSGQHTFRDVRIIGNCTNATVVGWGSEENKFYATEIYAVADKPALASAIKISELGFTPASNFQTLGTGAGGAGMWGLYGCRIANEQGAATTAALVDIRGALGWLFSNVYTAHAGTKTYQIGSSTYPSNAANAYPSSVTFDTCSDEDAWTAAPIVKDSIYFAAPSAGTVSLATTKGCVVKNSMFFNITAADTAIVDGFDYSGGKYANSVPSPSGTKMSFYDLTNSRIAPAKTERGLSYAVRHNSSAVQWVGIDTGNVAGGTGTYSLEDSTGNVTHTGFLKSASPTGGIGYESGAGGTVTQATSATTAVTLNKVTGRVTTVSLTLAAGASAQFQVNNSTVTSVDGPRVWIQSYTGAGDPTVDIRSVATGAFVVRVRNVHATDALDAAITIGFHVIKGATA